MGGDFQRERADEFLKPVAAIGDPPGDEEYGHGSRTGPPERQQEIRHQSEKHEYDPEHLFLHGTIVPSLTYSHSMVPGGFEVMSYTTRFTPFTSFTMRVEIIFNTSCGSGTQSAVIPSSELTARIAQVYA